CPITAEVRFVLIHQARIPVQKWLWEFPAGQVDDSMNPGPELLKATALRELAEESGYELTAVGELIDLGWYYASPGFTDEQQYLFLARPVRELETALKSTQAKLSFSLENALLK